MDNNKIRREYISRINKVLDYINANLDKDLTLEMLAGVASFSPFHFHRVFKGITGETIIDYCSRIRLQKSASMLAGNPDKSITEIALDMGFSSSSHFARSFKKHFKLSASEFRNKYDELNASIFNSNNCKTNSNDGKEFHSENYYLNDELNNNNRRETMNVEVKNLPGYRVAYVRVLQGYKHEYIGKAFDKIIKWAGARELINDKTLVIGISYDDPKVTHPDKCRYDACVTVADDIKPEGEIGVKEIKPGKYAVYRIESIYTAGVNDDFGKFWDELYRIWLPSSGYQPDDRDCFEIYYNDPKTDPEKKYIADICIPIKPL